MPPVKSFGERIADTLVQDGLLTNEQVTGLLERQKKDGTRLIKLIQDGALVAEGDLVVAMGRILNVPPVNLPRVAIAPDVAELIPKDTALSHKVIAISRLGSKLFLAMADPLNVLAVDDIKRITRMEVSPLIS